MDCDCDKKRKILIDLIQQELIKLNHTIKDSYVNEHTYDTDYDILTDKNLISLQLTYMNKYKFDLFDKLIIYDYGGDNILLECILSNNHTPENIIALITLIVNTTYTVK